MELTARVEDLAALETLERFALLTDRSIEETVKDQSRLLVGDLARLTPPFRSLQTTGSAKESWAVQRKLGEGAVMLDVQRCFPTIEDSAIAKAPRNPKVGEAVKAALENPGITEAALKKIVPALRNAEFVEPAPDLHNRQRNKRGRVPKGRRTGYIVPLAAKVKRFVKQKTKLVGRLKGGWVAAARALGASLPGWITRHGAGMVENNTKGDNPSVRMTNNVRYGGDQNREIRFAELALKNREAAMLRQIPKLIERAAKRAGR